MELRRQQPSWAYGPPLNETQLQRQHVELSCTHPPLRGAAPVSLQLLTCPSPEEEKASNAAGTCLCTRCWRTRCLGPGEAGLTWSDSEYQCLYNICVTEETVVS